MCLPLAPRNSFRLANVDYLDETPGLAWKANSCFVDAPFWLAKVLGLAQSSIDESATTNDEVRRAMWDTLRLTWRREAADVAVARDRIIQAWRRAQGIGAGDFGAARTFTDSMTLGLPSTTIKRVQRLSCCNRHKPKWTQRTERSYLGTGLGYEHDRLQTAKLSEIVSKLWAREVTKKKCGSCDKPVIKQACVPEGAELPLFLRLEDVPQNALDIRELVRFEYCCEPLYNTRKAEYQVVGALVHIGLHFASFAVAKDVEGLRVFWYDDISAKVNEMSTENLQTRLNDTGLSLVYIWLQKQK